ncbi:DegV family protein [Hutsoniella sourekii]|uniref:DegV family protein n=1 Tax=Hutsoniella sourekii TaxID=87650 RepID=UPI000489E4D7|nr:DegV family protein [Hutsoniella sourekii]
MKKWKIIADSGSDIRQVSDLNEEVAYSFVPLMLTVDNEIYIDNGDLSTKEFETILQQATGATSSACPSPDAYAEEFRGAENVFCVTITGSLSGSYNSARMGRDMVLEENPDANIYILDSHSASGEINLIIERACQLANEGVDFDQMVQEIEAYSQQTDLRFLLQSVQNLVKNGRVSKIMGQMIGMLNILLIGARTPEGTIELAHKSRGLKRGIRALVDSMVESGYKGGKVSITHVENKETADKIAKAILERFPEAEISYHLSSYLVTYYAETGGVLVGYEKA